MALAGAVGFDRVPGHSGDWELDLFCLCGYAFFGALTTGFSAINCPATGTVPASGDPRNATWAPPAEATPDAAEREYDWGDRAKAGHGGGCRGAAFYAGVSLFLLLFVLCIVCVELGAMRRDRR